MRKLLVGAAFVAGLAMPGLALAQSGHADVSYSNHTYDFGGGIEFDTDIAAIGGQVAFDAGALGIQLDGRYANWAGDADDVGVFGLGAHVFTRSENWLFGGYLGYDDADDFNIEAWTGALEAQFYMSRSTISGVLSHSVWDGPDYAITLLEGEYRHFFTDSVSAHVSLGFGQGDIGTTDPDVWSGEIGGEYLFSGAPVSIFGHYRHGVIDFNVGEIETDTLSVGIRYNWGGTLMDRNRSGAGLNRVTPVFERFLS
jgi:hypothetical protein